MTSHLFLHSSAKAKGFTMLELLVAMSVTVILLGMVTFMTGVSMDGYKGSRDKVLGGRQAKEALEAITQDFEAMVARTDGNDEKDEMWLYADFEPELDGDVGGSTTLAGPANKKIVNSCRLIFFTGATDRYDGDIGGDSDDGGDVSAVIYRLAYRDQISDTAPNAVGLFPSFLLYRHLVDPFPTKWGRKSSAGYDNDKALLGAVDLEYVYELGTLNNSLEGDTFAAENVIAENLYELTVTFLLSIKTVEGNPFIVRCTISPDLCEDFSISDKGVKWTGTIQLGSSAEIEDTDTSEQLVPNVGNITVENIENGDLLGVEINMTVLSERGLIMTQKGGMSPQEIINEYGTHYTDTVSVPRF
jgi:prepilin-type N-terminal cleavage/methylation domain-containing protein